MPKYYLQSSSLTKDLTTEEINSLSVGETSSLTVDVKENKFELVMVCTEEEYQQTLLKVSQLGIVLDKQGEVKKSEDPRLYNAIKTGPERQAEVEAFKLKYDKNNAGQLVDQVQRLETKIAELTKIIEESGIQYEDPDAEETKTLFQRIKGWLGL